MAKILISFLGTGSSTQKGTSMREYRSAKYSVEGKAIGESSFVSSLLLNHYQFDGLYLVGTCKSMWEEVYRYFCEKKDKAFDEDYYWKLSEIIEKANHKTDSAELDLKKLEEALGTNSKAVVIPYGLNKAEQIAIFSRLATAFEHLQDGDEVALDVTHSFRSLPLFATTVLNYFKTLSDKKIQFSKVYYGMLDAMREFDNVAPIVDISSVIELQNWTTAAYAFKEYGKGQLLADLLGDNIGKVIQIFSDGVNLNYLSEIQQRLTNFQKTAQEEFDNEFAQWVVPQVLKSFVNRLFKVGNKQYLFQYELSLWHRERQNYASAYIVFVESMITYVCEKSGVEWNDFNNRGSAKEAIRYYNRNSLPFRPDFPQEEKQSLKQLYIACNIIRNNIAHNLSDRSTKAEKDIQYLEQVQKEFYRLIKRFPVK